ncbi:hypothetical protein HMI55_003867 [Coelomomyces lativittatus]|nr:hypothetical protein HMI55_003867 [Coelomomyces lativittatus]
MMSADLMDSPFLLVSRGTDPTTANPNITTSISINNGTSTSSASSSSSSSTTSPTTHTTATSTTTTSSSPSFPLYSSTPLQPTHPHSLLTALTPTSTNTLTPPTPSLGLPNTFTSLPLQTQVELLNKYRATDFFEGLPTLFEAVKGSFQETLNKEHAVLAMENNQIVLGQGNTGKQAPNWLVIEELELVKLLLQESIVSRTDPKWELICNAMSALRHRRLFTITVCNKARIRIIRRYLECKRVLINEFQRGNLQFTLLGQCVEKVIRLNESAKINPTSSSSSSATSSPTSSSSSLSNSNSHSSNIHKTNGLPTAKRLRTHSFSSSNSPPSLLSSPPPPTFHFSSYFASALPIFYVLLVIDTANDSLPSFLFVFYHLLVLFLCTPDFLGLVLPIRFTGEYMFSTRKLHEHICRLHVTCPFDPPSASLVSSTSHASSSFLQYFPFESYHFHQCVITQRFNPTPPLS